MSRSEPAAEAPRVSLLLTPSDSLGLALTGAAALAALALCLLLAVRQPALAVPTYSPEAPWQLDVNRATWPELTLVPGVGPVLARRIVERRESAGLYRSLEDLLEVKGIGKIRLADMRPYLVIGEAAAGGSGEAGSPPDNEGL